MARRSGFKMDMHVHSKYSGESMSEPEEIIATAVARGLDGICITEHESLWASRPFEELRSSTNLIILRGVEVSTDAGHMLVYGVNDDEWQDWGKGQTPPAQELVCRARRLGGLVVPAHPYIVKAPFCGRSPEDKPIFEVDERVRHIRGLGAIEVCNGKHLNHPLICRALGNMAKSMGLPSIGGSDAHTPENVGCVYTVFRAPVRSNAELVEILRKGWVHPENHVGPCGPLPSTRNIRDIYA